MKNFNKRNYYSDYLHTLAVPLVYIHFWLNENVELRNAKLVCLPCGYDWEDHTQYQMICIQSKANQINARYKWVTSSWSRLYYKFTLVLVNVLSSLTWYDFCISIFQLQKFTTLHCPPVLSASGGHSILQSRHTRISLEVFVLSACDKILKKNLSDLKTFHLKNTMHMLTSYIWNTIAINN